MKGIIMKIKSNTLPPDVLKMIKNPDPIKGEDICIEDDDGNAIGYIIQPKAYDFFLTKIREKEDELDSAISEKYDPNSKTLDDLMGGEKDTK
jgi:hypothetical protein